MESKMENHVTGNNRTVEMDKDAAGLLPHLESLERMMKLPVVGAAWQQSQGVYEKVKSHNRMFNWAFSTAEDAVHLAVSTAAPIVSKFDRPIHYIDETLVKGIDKLEVTAPIIKEQPQAIYNQAKTRVMDVVQPHINKVCALRVAGQQKAATLKELSYQKVNEVLATQYGSMAVNSVDHTSALAERLLDYYFPKTDADIENDDAPISAAQDPVLHTVQTVGRLSNKVARRVYCSVSRQVKQLKKEDVHDYVASLIAVLRLTQYLNFINERVQAASHTNENSSSSTSNSVAKPATVNSSTSPNATSSPAPYSPSTPISVLNSIVTDHSSFMETPEGQH